MIFQWDFFENYNGGVYITEADTNRLIYMNACLRHSLGFGDGEEYKGLLCQEVLQRKKEGFSFRDTLVCRDGTQRQVELTIDLGAYDESEALPCAFRDQILNECLGQILSTADEEQAIDSLLRYIGEDFLCERVYIFELADQIKVNNTYEWCAREVVPQREVLQNVPYDTVAFWFDIFDRREILSIGDLEEIRESYPMTYACLQPQGIHSLMAGPIQVDGGYRGFIGVDNPAKETLPVLSFLLRVIGPYVSVLLQRRDRTAELCEQSRSDMLTGALNRNTLLRFFDENMEADTLGIVYCDISGLKQVNALYGHAAGDELIRQSYRLIVSVMEGGGAYRIGGGEFVVVCLDITQQEFLRQIEMLRRRVAEERYHIAVGGAWTDTFPASFDELLRRADQEMYEDKRQYYCNCDVADRRSRDRRKGQRQVSPQFGQDLERLLPALTANDRRSYVCIGDYQSRCYYISDGMKEKFGFSSNVVYDFVSQWEERIIGHEQKQLFRKNIEQMLQERQTNITFSYTMKDRGGKIIMVRSSGLVQWDDAYTEPITILGSAHIEKDAFLTDPITAFPTLQGAVEELESLKESAIVLLFKLNHFGKINESKGRDVGNQLLTNIAADLREHFQGAAAFYRLEGMKFMGILRDGNRHHQEFIDEIRGIVTKRYKQFEVAVAESLTFMPIEYSNKKERPLDLIQNVAALISAAELSPVSQAITNAQTYLSGLKKEIDMEFALVHDIQNQMANFRIVIQPVVSAATEEILGGEVLLRWTFQDKEVSPGIFIPLIERQKLMGLVGKWVLEQTAQCCRNLSVYRPDMYLTFNVSYQQILAYHFEETIRTTLQKYGIDGKRMVVELTETYEDEAPIRLQTFVDACGKMGVRIALDDFGNGYSSLGLLLKYSAQIIKLDRSILLEMLTSQEKEKFVCGLVESCHRLDKLVCVEGVETEKELEAATKAGCDIIQGFYYYRPMELYDLYQEIIKGHSGAEASSG